MQLELLAAYVCVFLSVSRVCKTNGHIHSSHQSPLPPWEHRQQGGQSSGTRLQFPPCPAFPLPLAFPTSLPSVCNPSRTLPAPVTPRSYPQIYRKALISMEEEVDREGGPLATSTQLVWLIKRVCGLWVRAQAHQEAGETYDTTLFHAR